MAAITTPDLFSLDEKTNRPLLIEEGSILELVF
jgi:hypothetical protein